ncbi:hypothetical protein ACFSJ3_05545 [Corallincola platygyrae]|uniref:DUF4386 family protein n=1 Tax=Corallincola platygyrae TaxID=1193278 RepID=A0ABW4XMB0_9GAMM
MEKLQKIGGIAAIVCALTYIIMFIFYGAVLDFPSDASWPIKLDYIESQQTSFTVMNLIGYFVFGIALALLVQATYSKAKENTPALAQTATLFGVIWVAIIISAGMVANIGMQTVLELKAEEPEQTRSVWIAFSIVRDALGGGIELVGALWVLLISVAMFKTATLSKALNILGIVVGAFGVLTLIPLDLFKELFGLSQIIWFIWLGIALVRTQPQPTRLSQTI